MISKKVLKVYLLGTGMLGGYSVGRTAYANPRWDRLEREEGLHGEVMIARTLVTLFGITVGAVAGPVLVPLQALRGVTEGIRDWVHDKDHEAPGARGST
jgi:hypothetical protein